MSGRVHINDGDPAHLQLALCGQLDAIAPGEWVAVLQAIGEQTRRVTVALDQIAYLDTENIPLLLELRQMLEAKQVQADFTGPPGAVQRILAAAGLSPGTLRISEAS